jgi:hypothetical protein
MMGGSASADFNTTVSDGEFLGLGEKVAGGAETDKEQDRTSILVDPRKELYDSTVIDPVLARKMTLVNDAIDEIGMTPFQWKLFFLNGFGYAVDSVRKDK